MEGLSVREEVSADRAGGGYDRVSHLRHLPFEWGNLNTAGPGHQSFGARFALSEGRSHPRRFDCGGQLSGFFHFWALFEKGSCVGHAAMLD
jgi:hypothetical protein